MADNNSKPAMKCATEEEAIEAAKEKMVNMGQFQGWADDVDDEGGYYHQGPPYSTVDDLDGALCEDEHTVIHVVEIKEDKTSNAVKMAVTKKK